MKLGMFIQQPTERETYTINYQDDLTEGDNLKSASAVIEPEGLTLDGLYVIDPRLRLWFKDGVKDTAYKITVTAETEDGRVLVDHFIIKIKEY